MFHLLNKYLKEFKNIFAQDYRNISPGKEPFIYETLLVSDKVILLLGYLLAPEFPLISCGCLIQGFNQCYQSSPLLCPLAVLQKPKEEGTITND